MTWINNHYFFVVVLTLLFLSITSSYYKFVYSFDYYASYETDCDPETHSCYVWCEEDDPECTDPYYYAYIERYAPDLNTACGANVENCEFAHDCSISPDKHCSIGYCDSESGYYDCSELIE